MIGGFDKGLRDNSVKIPMCEWLIGVGSLGPVEDDGKIDALSGFKSV